MIITNRDNYKYNSLESFITSSDINFDVEQPAKSFREAFGKRLRDARNEQKLKQPQLARLCGWDSQSRISQYERGRRMPKIEEVIEIARHVKRSAAYLLFGEPDPSGGVTLSPRQAALVKSFDGLTDDQQEEAIQKIETTKQTNDAVFEALSKKRA